MSKFLLVPALLAAAIAGPAAAGDHMEPVIVTIETRDLDLARADAQRRLERRIQSAIGDVCRYGRLDLRAAQRASECRKLARAQADSQARLAIAQARLEKARLAAMASTPPA